jgi:beta-glucanase (GH16 family)
LVSKRKAGFLSRPFLFFYKTSTQNEVLNKKENRGGQEWTSASVWTKKTVSIPDADLSKEFHVYGHEWTMDSLIYYFDGKPVRRMKNEFCYSPVPVYFSEAIISWAGEVTDAISGTSMYVDCVKVYQKN